MFQPKKIKPRKYIYFQFKLYMTCYYSFKMY